MTDCEEEGLADSGSHKILVVAGGGGFCRQTIGLLRHCPEHVTLVVLGPPGIEKRLRAELNGRAFRFRTIPFVRRLRRERGILASLPDVFVGTASALVVLAQERPDGVVGVCQRAAVFFFLAARMLRRPTVFVESITRVTKPSWTAQCVARFRLADMLYVQWPSATLRLRGSIYQGRLL